MQENVFFNENGILVTNARFVTAQTTYALAQISSVRKHSEQRDGGPRQWIVAAVLCLVLASVLAFTKVPGCAGLLVPIALFLLVVAAFAKKRFNHYIFITTSAGEIPGIVDADEALIGRIHDALTLAIVSRA